MMKVIVEMRWSIENGATFDAWRDIHDSSFVPSPGDFFGLPVEKLLFAVESRTLLPNGDAIVRLQDSVLADDKAEDLRQALEEAGWTITVLEFREGKTQGPPAPR